ncbi:MAG: hypothetical protein Q7T56_09065 [Nocardioidaceae bacterium]|nr:hypothetical protein [Nocardioidaceae bacterium]
MTTAVRTRHAAAGRRRMVGQVIESALMRNRAQRSAGAVVRSVLVCAADLRADDARDSPTVLLSRSEAWLTRTC